MGNRLSCEERFWLHTSPADRLRQVLREWKKQNTKIMTVLYHTCKCEKAWSRLIWCQLHHKTTTCKTATQSQKNKHILNMKTPLSDHECVCAETPAGRRTKGKVSLINSPWHEKSSSHCLVFLFSLLPFTPKHRYLIFHWIIFSSPSLLPCDTHRLQHGTDSAEKSNLKQKSEF